LVHDDVAVVSRPLLRASVAETTSRESYAQMIYYGDTPATLRGGIAPPAH